MIIGRTDAKAEAPIFCLPDAENQFIEKTLLIGKDPDLGKKVEGKKEKRAAEDEMVR